MRNMRKFLASFARDEDGAVTVDWVVLTAAVVALNIVVLVWSMRSELVGVSESIGEKATEYGEFLN
jgi:Flp pilus assembly pilin Flp